MNEALMSVGALSLASLLALTVPCRAGAEHLSPEFREEAVAACTGDAVRLCATSLLDEEKTAACMKTYRAALSPNCRAVYDRGIRARHP